MLLYSVLAMCLDLVSGRDLEEHAAPHSGRPKFLRLQGLIVLKSSTWSVKSRYMRRVLGAERSPQSLFKP